jgi:lipoate-protein ligase A
MQGRDTMAYDEQTLEQLQQGAAPAVRFYQWLSPTISFGRLQKQEHIRDLIPQGWKAVQRPTGGGIVFHDQDLCVSLCWREGDAPLPTRLKEVYPWIHGIIREALAPFSDLQMARCDDCQTAETPFQSRQCFTEPVVFDLLRKGKKVVGGALCRRGDAFLYQGSIQGYPVHSILPALTSAFTRCLASPGSRP